MTYRLNTCARLTMLLVSSGRYRGFSNRGLLLLFAIFLTMLRSPAFGDQYDRKLWLGTFEQHGLFEWTGPMELYVRFDGEDDYPIRVTGIITWQSLGSARTLVDGTLSQDGELSLTEKSCLSGDCSQVVVGGKYTGQIRKQNLSGTAASALGLKGSFQLDLQ